MQRLQKLTSACSLNVISFPYATCFSMGIYELTVESRFYEPPRKTNIGSKNRRVREIAGNITVLD